LFHNFDDALLEGSFTEQDSYVTMKNLRTDLLIHQSDKSI